MLHLLPCLALALALGACCAAALRPVHGTALLALSGLLLALALQRDGRRLALVGLLAAALATGAAAAVAERERYDGAGLRRWLQEGHENATVEVVGSLAADPESRPDRWSLTIDVVEIRQAGAPVAAAGRARIDVNGEAARPLLRGGDRVRVWARLRLPRPRLSPGAPDPEERARSRRLHAFGSCKSPQLVVREEVGGGALRLAADARAWARQRLVDAVPVHPEGALLRAMVIGEKTDLDDETGDAFRAAGTYHVLAISGAQVALLAGLLAWGLTALRCPPAAVALLTSTAVAFYAAFVGFEVPVARAALMAAVVLAGRALEIETGAVDLLAAAAAGLILERPTCLDDLSFQLTFGATLGLALLAPPLEERWPRLPTWLRRSLACSLAAQAALLPVVAEQFHRLPLLAPLLNLLAVPLAGAVLFAGLFVLLAAGLVPLLLPAAAPVAFWAARLLLLTARPLGDTELPQLDLPDPPLAALLVYGGGLAALATRRRRKGLLFAAAGALWMWAGPPVCADGRLELAVLDVGQGDALVVRSPGGRHWVVDAGPGGGSFDAGEQVVAPYLFSEGVRRLRGAVVTHAHADHAGGLRSLLRPFAVGEVIEGVAAPLDPAYRRLEADLRARPTGRRAVVAGMRFEWDGVQVEVMGPSPGLVRSRNDESVVLRLVFGDASFLLPGDVEAAGEAALPAAADVVKVPHHGSRSSSGAAWLARLRPRLAVLSVGRGNRFGHPDPSVVRRYQDVGACVLRTDRDGSVRVMTDGKRIWYRASLDGVERRIR